MTRGLMLDRCRRHLIRTRVRLQHPAQVLMTVVLFVEKINELAVNGMEAPDIYDRMCQYVKHTRMYFSLASLNNLARNGRVNPILAKGVGLLGIRIEHMINSMKECGY